MKKYNLFFGFIFGMITIPATAQVPKRIIVEHFTNTVCSICGSRNPGFYSNLETKPDILHVAVHPSRPYKNCVFNVHNPSENDARANFYGVFGSTPRLVIQGEVIPSNTSYDGSTLFDAFANQTSPFSMSVTTVKSDNDSLTARVVITTKSAHNYAALSLYVTAVEDTIKYAAPNGETEHYDVFRKQLLDQSITNLSTITGDSVVFYVKSATHSEWNKNQMYAMAILQDANTKEVVQAAKSVAIITESSAGIANFKLSDLINAYPNPLENELTVQLKEAQVSVISILDINGKIIYSKTISDLEPLKVNLSSFPSGIYTLTVLTNSIIATQKIIKM